MLQREKEFPEGLTACTLRGMPYADLKAEGVKFGLFFKIADDLEQELLKDKPQNRSRRGPVAYYPHLFLPESGNKALTDQFEMVFSEAQKFRGRLRLKEKDVGRFTEYGEIILENLKKGIRLLERGRYPYLSARTSTRVFDGAGPQNYVVDIGPLDPDGLCVHILGRDEPDPEIGVWPLFYLRGT